MFAIAFIFTFVFGYLNEQDTLLLTSGLFAIASAIESFTYKYFKYR